MRQALRDLWHYQFLAFAFVVGAFFADGPTWAVLLVGGAICLHLGRIERQGDRRPQERMPPRS